MTKFKFDNCTSKQFVRREGWIPAANHRLKRMAQEAKVQKEKSVRRLRYLTFCAEGAIDVVALRNAKIIKRSTQKLYDTVVFFDFAPQAVDKTLDIIEGATGFPTDFFRLVNLDETEMAASSNQVEGMPRNKTESDLTFNREKDAALFAAFRAAFPFDLINLDVERYVVKPSENLPGHLITAWDKILEWQKLPRSHQNRTYTINEFTLFFTTKLGPPHLPEPHRTGLINVVEQNVIQFPSLKDTLKERYGVETASALYDSDFASFLKLAVPKALVSRALQKDWLLDSELSYRAFAFDRTPPSGAAYTMVHYVLHFKRCVPSLTSQINPLAIPPAVATAYGDSVSAIFAASYEDVDQLKASMEAELREELQKLGVPAEALAT